MSRDEQGFLTSAVKTLFDALKYLSPMGHLQVTPATTEWYVLVSLFLEFIVAVNVTQIAGWASLAQWMVLTLAALKILEIVRVAGSVVLFDEGGCSFGSKNFYSRRA